MEDKEIIGLFFRRDSSAIDESQRKYGAALKRTAGNILSDPQDSEECVNDTYFAAWNSIPPTEPRSLGAYLISLVRNISISRLREHCAQKRGGGEYAVAFDELEEVVSAGKNPEEEMESRELGMAINRFLTSLKDDDRIIFVSRYWLVESVKEISQRLAMSESRVKSSLFRSRNGLRKQLRKEGYL